VLSNKVRNENDDELESLAEALSKKFDTKITIENYHAGGKLVFHYSSLEKLDQILAKIS
jgi:ParB family chromosome partitioning protein